MTTPAPPPILEIEDQPQSNRPDYPPSEHLQSTPPPPTPHQEPETTLLQARDFPEPHINDHAAFWSTYNKEAEEYDAEMLKGWNNSLDVLLIFAGLFSAVNTAFIIESYKGLSTDPAETTNALLRLLIIHRSDNITLTSEDLNPGEVNSSAISVNYIFFASLYSSLFAAFGAVTAKQWLTEYSNKGPAKAPHVLGFQRTMKFKGLKEWHFQLLMDLLPILLQLSLLLFLVGVVEFLSVLDRKVGMMQLVLVVGGTAVYALTLIIGIIYPTSPFRTPVINYIRGIVKFCIDHSLFIAAIIKLVGSIKKKRLRFTLFMLLETLLSPIADCFIVIAVLWKYAWPGSQASERGGEPRWNDDEQRAAESVIWLLENSEHPDTTVVTLDAARRLHPDLMSSMIAQQQGLSERLEKFCASMLPQGSEGRLQWFEELSDGAVVSLIAWRHIHPNLRFPFTKSPENLYQYPIVIDNTPKGYSLAIRILVAHNIGARFISEKASLWGSEFSSGGAERRSSWLISILKSIDFYPKTYQIDIRPDNGMGTSIFTTLSIPLSLPQLALDALILASFDHDPVMNSYSTRAWNQVPWNDVPLILHAILQADPSPRNIRHVALVVATIRQMFSSNSRRWKYPFEEDQFHSRFWSYPSKEDQSQLRKHINDLAEDLRRSPEVGPYIELVLSLVDGPGDEVFCTPTDNIYYTILKHTKETLMKKPPSGFRFYASLLRLSRIYPRDPPTQHLVFELLGLCKRWDDAIDYKDDILRVLQYGFSLAGHHSLEHPDSPLQKLPYVLTDTSGDELFLHIFPTIYSLHTTDGSAGTSFLLTVPQFIRNRILCSDSSKSPHSTITLGYQIFLALVIILNQLNEEDTFALTFFLSSMLRDAELQWSPYLPSNSIEEIVQSYRDLLNQANNFHYFDYQERVVRKRINIIICEHNSKNSWRGDWTMLLWKSACKTFHQGRLPDDWNDAAFFNESIVDMMVQYYRHMKQQQYVGMDRDTLRSYFETALGKGWQPGGDDGQLSVPRHSGEDQHQDLRESVEDGSISKAIFEGEEIDIVQSSGTEGAAPDESRRAEERYRAVQEILNELDNQSRRT